MVNQFSASETNRMAKKATGKKIAFVVPTLSKSSAQNEDIVQLVLFASFKPECMDAISYIRLELSLMAQTKIFFAAI